ncbi:MAG: hypothetical protein CMN84_01415 [Spongiibacteraceae bacterium]|nr:hypothetical protein [Spongiibacteraceae bacterium]
MKAKKVACMADSMNSKSVVYLKTAKSEKHWVYVLEAYESGNSTEYIVCFDGNDKLRGFVVIGQWEFDAFFSLASRVSGRLKQVTGGQKSLTVSLPWDDATPMRFKAEKEGDRDLWKAIFSCPEPSQCWQTWNSGSGSRRNFILYLTWSQMVSLFETLIEIQELDPVEGGVIEHTDSWVEKSCLNELEHLPKQIVQSAREAIKNPPAYQH